MRSTHLKSKPYILSLELSNRCNYRCPFCPTGKRADSRTAGWVSLETVKKAVADVKDTAFMASLHGWGEPLLHPQFDEAIAAIRAAGIYTVLSTNSSQFTPENVEKVLDSGLDHIILAIDGTSQETYSKYRVGGNYDNVIQGAKLLLERRRARGLTKPFIEWQFVVFKHNEHEMKTAQKLAHEMGFDEIQFMPAYTESDAYEPREKKYQARKSPLSKPSDCKFLWTSLTVYWDGRIAACCWDYYATSGFGNLMEKPFGELWNNPVYVQARQLAGEHEAPVGQSKLICNDCIKNINVVSPQLHEMTRRKELKQASSAKG